MIKSVCFDVDGVLVDTFDANLLFFQRLMKKVGRVVPTREQYKSMFHQTLAANLRILMPDASIEQLEKVFEIGKDRTKLYPFDLVKLPTNVESVLIKLRKKYVLSIVTSRLRGGVFGLPQLKPFEKYFDQVVHYEDTDKHKPEPEPLLLVAKQLNIRPEYIVYIGDAETDMQAAQAAGCKCIGYGKSAVAGALITISSFSELPPKLLTL